MEVLRCSYCATADDPDTFISEGRVVLCRDCRTCDHGHVHYENGRADVCYECLRRCFSTEWFWGPAIDDLDDFINFAVRSRLRVPSLQGWTWEEQEALSNRLYQRWGDFDAEVDVAQFPAPWIAP